MARFFAFSVIAVALLTAWTALGPRFSHADPPAAGNPFDAGPPAAAADENRGRHVAAAPSATPVPTREIKSPRSHGEILQALEQPTMIDFTETPLADALQYLSDVHGIEIQLDHRALEDEGIGSDSPITRKLHDVSLASALQLLLSDIESTFIVRDGILLITTQDAAARVVELRVYEIGGLVDSTADANELAEVLRSLFSDASSARYAQPASPGAAKGTRTTAPPPAPRFDVRPFRNLLIVRATQVDHTAVAELLEEIKENLKQGK